MKYLSKGLLISLFFCGCTSGVETDLDAVNQKLEKYFKEGSYDLAITYTESALKHFSPDKIEENKVTHIKILDKLADLYLLNGENEKAEELLRTSLEVKEKEFGKDHISLVPALDSFAFLYQAKNLPENAEKNYVRIIEIKKLHFGDEHPEVVSSLRTLGLFYEADAQFEKAKELFLEIRDIESRTLSSEYERVTTYRNLSGIYGALSEFAEQEKVLKASLAITERHVSETSPELAEEMYRLGTFYLYAKEDFESAEGFLMKAIQIQEENDEKDLFFHSVLLNNLADLHRKKGNESKAKEYERSADDALKLLNSEPSFAN
jgi:tetratricopeptide (TPR) repeat protein